MLSNIPEWIAKQISIGLQIITSNYRLIAMTTTAILQSITWVRLTLHMPVDSSLTSPPLWITFYAVLAGNDLLDKYIGVYLGSKGNASGSDSSNTTQQSSGS